MPTFGKSIQWPSIYNTINFAGPWLALDVGMEANMYRYGILFLSALSAVSIGCARGSDSNSKSMPDAAAVRLSVMDPQNFQPIVERPSQVSGTADRSDYPISNALDYNRATFMTTPTLTTGEKKTILFRFDSPVSISAIEFIDDYTNEYSLGDVVISASKDSTDGANGSWENIASVNYYTHPFTDGDGIISAEANNILWVRMEMTYSGKGAYGSTPSFYLSEINFLESINP